MLGRNLTLMCTPSPELSQFKVRLLTCVSFPLKCGVHVIIPGTLDFSLFCFWQEHSTEMACDSVVLTTHSPSESKEGMESEQ